MFLPFVLLAKNRKKTWCTSYCPRSNLFTKLFKGRNILGRTPLWLIKGQAKWFMLGYFSVNLSVMFLSTVMVAKGRMLPMEQIRLFMVLALPIEMPQIFQLGELSGWVVHLSYRMYSMMLTTTILGLLLGMLFLPRTWCTVCPINTVSDLALAKSKERNVYGNNERKVGLPQES
ncbi:MAG: 4Fe-4S binding protein [Bacillota bacterium]